MTPGHKGGRFLAGVLKQPSAGFSHDADEIVHPVEPTGVSGWQRDAQRSAVELQWVFNYSVLCMFSSPLITDN